MALPCLFISYASDKGRGVFTREALPAGTLIEEAPVIVLSGEQGSAKSTFSSILRALLDPNTAPLRALPREDRDL